MLHIRLLLVWVLFAKHNTPVFALMSTITYSARGWQLLCSCWVCQILSSWMNQPQVWFEQDLVIMCWYSSPLSILVIVLTQDWTQLLLWTSWRAFRWWPILGGPSWWPFINQGQRYSTPSIKSFFCVRDKWLSLVHLWRCGNSLGRPSSAMS